MDRKARKELVARINRDGAILARRFGLRYRAIEAERANVTSRYGVCFSDGTIRIRLRHAVTGRPLKYSSLVSTLCHELAHLRHFNHGLAFQRLYAEILDYARVTGVYRPSPRRKPAPVRQDATEEARVAAVRPETPPRRRRTESPRRREGPEQLDLFG